MKNPFNQPNPLKLDDESGKKKTSSRVAKNRLAYKGISRIDSDHNHTHGWYVRIRQNGKVRSKFFSDRKYGGISKALMKARRYYRKQMQLIFQEALGSVPDKIPDRVIVTKNKHNNTGVIGVQRIERSNPGGSTYRAYRVCWTGQDGKARTKFFSINKYGEKKAFKMACQHRKDKLLNG